LRFFSAGPFRSETPGGAFLREALEISDFKEDPKRERGGMAQQFEFIHSY
jgi:hypothetical protein